jgi:hypothetical protein
MLEGNNHLELNTQRKQSLKWNNHWALNTQREQSLGAKCSKETITAR